MYRRADGKDTDLLKLARKHGTLDALQTYAVLAGCDYDTKLRGVGPKQAIQLMCAHGTDLEAIAGAKPSAPADWAAKLQKGVDCFRDPIVYDDEAKVQRCLSSARGSAMRGYLGTACPPSQARDRALGLITPDSEAREVVRVEREPCEEIARGDLEPGWLTFEMVEGSKLPVMPVHQNSLATLQRFLKTRSHPASGFNKADLVLQIEQLLGLEEGNKASGNWVRLRDPDGGSLHTYLRDRRGLRFPHLSGECPAPPFDSAEWITGIDKIAEVCPVLERITMFLFYGVRMRGVKELPKVLKDGYQRMFNRRGHQLRFHPGDGVCWFQCDIPASMKPLPYKVTLAMEYLECMEEEEEFELPATPRLATKILNVCCSCPAGAGGDSPHCIHGAALLWIIHNLPREDPVAKPYVPCTSSACRWNIPGQGEVYDVLKPVAHMPITRDDPSKPFKRHHPSRSKEAERAKYVAYTPNDARNNVRDAPTRVAAMATLCEVIKGDLEGAPCAYDRQWQMTAAVTDDDDF